MEKVMKRKNSFKEWLFWLMVGASLALMFYNTFARWRGTRKVNLPPPQIERGITLVGTQLTHLTGDDVTISGKGRELISFMTTDCKACQRQVQSLNEIAKATIRYDNISAVFFEPAATVLEFQASFNPEFNCLLDSRNQLATRLQLDTFPQTVELVNGVVVKSWVGLERKFE